MVHGENTVEFNTFRGWKDRVVVAIKGSVYLYQSKLCSAVWGNEYEHWYIVWIKCLREDLFSVFTLMSSNKQKGKDVG